MKQFKSLVILILFLQINSSFLIAQNYPVQITTLLTPPFSGYISDYSSIGNQNLKLIITFNDFTKPSYNIKLKFKLSGQNINLQSKNYYYEGPFTLIPGVPLEINGSDLAGLLSSNNLDFTGLSKQQYESGKVLPEGLYTLTFTAYDFDNPVAIQVSNQSSYSAWMLLNDPPYLNMPFCGSVQQVINPQNIIFQWTSMNLVSPNSVNSNEYEFSLYEVRPKGANPNNILQTLPPIYQTTTNITSLNYGITEPVLNVGMDYVWRVKAIDITGRDLFKNQGYSQLCTFTYGSMNQFIDSNAIAIVLQGVPVNYRLAKCFWDTLNVYKSYQLYYRKQNGTNWFTNTNIQRSYDHIQNLEPSSTYEAYVKGTLLDNGEGPASNTVIINTPPKTEYVCGQSPGMPPTQNKPLQVAMVGQLWEIGQFEVMVTSLTNPVSPIGQYSGYGKVAVPFLGNANFNVKFNNIFVNEEFQVIAGRVDVITEGLATWMHNIDIHNAEENATYINGTITSFTIINGQYCYTLQGSSTQICDTLPSTGNVFVVRDDNGNQYTINLNPPPPTVTGPTSYLNYSTDNLDASDSAMVAFNASSAQNFGFDKKEYAAFTENYEVIKLKSTKNYFVPNKSVGENQTDEVLAQVAVVGFSATQLSFKTASGTNLSFVNQGNNVYKITGIPSGANSVYAWYNNKKIGKLNISNLKAIAKKVMLVPVNSANASITASQLNDIFKQANVTWSVSTAPNFTFNLGQDGLEAADANLMSKYSGEMRALRDAYKLFDSLYDKNAYYLFVVPNFNTSGLKGYMVRGRALGFIIPSASVKEIAHELGHGAFGLEHSFPKIAKNTSNNLMDYSQGIQMVKEQWAGIQNGPSTLSLFDSEEDAQYCAYQAADNITIFETLKQIKTCYNKNTSMPITQFANSFYSAYSTTNAFVAGIQYNYIRIYKDLGNNLQKTTISPKNNITSEEKTAINAVGPNTLYGLIKVDNAIYIEVPANRRVNMEMYLKSPEGKNLMLFVNGYRTNISFDLTEEFSNSMNKVNSGDIYGYWSGIDAEFMQRIGVTQAIYADGHHSISTSNHLSKMYFAASLESSTDPSMVTILNTKPNIPGFSTRLNYGKVAANDMLTKINNGTISFNKNSDTLYIACHSMGFAYAQGMIEVLRNAGVKITRYYIIAPENGCTGQVIASTFEEIWQYGTNEIVDPPKQRDGVAPQCLVGGLTSANRAFIPSGEPKSFLDCHYINNYHWIFSRTLSQNGYVSKRK